MTVVNKTVCFQKLAIPVPSVNLHRPLIHSNYNYMEVIAQVTRKGFTWQRTETGIHCGKGKKDKTAVKMSKRELQQKSQGCINRFEFGLKW